MISLAQHTLKLWANRLSYALSHQNVPQGSKNALGDILISAAEEANIFFDDPEIVKGFYPILIESLPDGYDNGTHHALKAIYETLCVQTDGFDDSQFQVRYSEYETIEGISEATGGTLATIVSDLLNNLYLPRELREHLRAGLGEMFDGLSVCDSDGPLADFEETPEYLAILFDRCHAKAVKETKETLDLSEQPENYDITGLQSLAGQISEVWTNPLFPDRLRHCFDDELNQIHASAITEPANVLENLKTMLKAEETK